MIIGKFCQIASEIHIGDGVIIGANSVVGSNVDPYTIVAGNPARPIRKRFTGRESDEEYRNWIVKQ